MTSTFPTLGALVLAACLSGGAWAQDKPMQHGHGGMHDHGGAKANDGLATKAFKQADARMMRDMAVPYTGDADVDFRTHMIPHHQGAVAMAKVALIHARDPQTRAMAQAIIDDQEKEIAQMRDWLKAKGH